MDLKSAKKLLNEMIELCAQLEDTTLNEACEGIYSDITTAKSLEYLSTSARELMVFISEVPDYDDQVMDTKQELENMYNDFLEELGEI